MNIVAIFTSVIILMVYLISHSDSKSICKQVIMNSVEVVRCPPSESDEERDFKYCCTKNNGLVSCCNYVEFQRINNGPSTKTIFNIIIVEVSVVILLVLWCFKCYRNHNYSNTESEK